MKIKKKRFTWIINCGMSFMKIFIQPSQNIKLAIFSDNEGAENIFKPAI